MNMKVLGHITNKQGLNVEYGVLHCMHEEVFYYTKIENGFLNFPVPVKTEHELKQYAENCKAKIIRI